MGTKTCTKCEVEKQVSEFYKHPLAKDGLQTRCKSCTVGVAMENRKQYYHTNKAKFKKYSYKVYNKLGSGVYEIYENGVSLYIGSSKTLTRRIYNHKCYIKNPSTAQPSLAYLYPLLQQHQCEFRILETCDDYIEKEKQYINQLKPKYNKNGA